MWNWKTSAGPTPNRFRLLGGIRQVLSFKPPVYNSRVEVIIKHGKSLCLGDPETQLFINSFAADDFLVCNTQPEMYESRELNANLPCVPMPDSVNFRQWNASAEKEPLGMDHLAHGLSTLTQTRISLQKPRIM